MSAYSKNNCLWYYSLFIGRGKFDCVHNDDNIKNNCTQIKYQRTYILFFSVFKNNLEIPFKDILQSMLYNSLLLQCK